MFNDNPEHYRVKPEPKYRPFTNEELRQQVGKVFTERTSKKPSYLATGFAEDCLYLAQQGRFTSPYLLLHFSIDNHPAGVLE